MFRQQRQSLDVKSPPPPPPKMFGGTIENRQTTSDQKGTPGLFRKFTSKLKSPVMGQFTTSTTAKRNSTVRVNNDFTSKEQREAALRACGLVAAPKKDPSQVDQNLDLGYTKTTPTPREQTTKDGQQSAAEKIMQEWKAKNQASRR